MVEYVYALHDFVPEHDDEVSFRAGERIEVVEKDDLYGDGWWQGRNLAGKVGLFPKSYTQAAPSETKTTPASAAPTSATAAAPSSPAAAVATPTSSSVLAEPSKQPTSPKSLKSLSLLQPLAEEPETMPLVPTQIPSPTPFKGATSDSDHPHTNGDGEVMRATMTDVQQAIEQLGHATDDGTRSFSFSSTREGDSTDHETDAETDGDGENNNDDFYRNARQKLAQRARRAVEEAAAREAENVSSRRNTAPPIDVEVSDESEGEDGDDDEGPLDSPSPTRQRRPSYIAEEEEEDITMLRVPSETTQVPALASRSSSGSVVPSEGYIVPSPATKDDAELHTATQSTFPLIDTDAASERASSAALPSPVTPGTRVSSAPEPRNSRPSSLQAFVDKQATSAVQDAATAVPIVPMGSMQEAAALLPSPAASSAGNAVGSARSSLQVAVQQQRQTSPVRMPSSHPSDWTVEEVADWLRSKGFDEGTCDKFIEQEITGDVLLELDVNLLKTEIGIAAFGKRMRIANAITELRRPPSVVSSEHNRPLRSHSQTQSVSYSVATSSAQQSLNSPYQAIPGISPPASAVPTTPGSNGNGFANVMSPESPPHTGDIAGTPAPRMRRDSDPGVPPHLKGPNGSEATIGLGLGIPTALLLSPTGSVKIADRPAQLTLSPSDGALSSTVKAVGGAIPEEGDGERAALSESETAKHVDARSKRRRVFGRSESNSSKNKEKDERDSGSRTSKDGSTLVADDAPATTVRTNSRKRSLDASHKGSDRLSIFGGLSGTLGKSRKPAPRYSSFVDTADLPSEKSPSTLSRLYAGPRKARRPSTSDGPSSSSLKPHNEKRDSKDSKDSRGEKSTRDTAVLRKRTSSAAEVPARDVAGVGGLKAGQSILQQIGTPDHNGWMRKKSDRYNTWKNRYFVLKGPHLYWLRSNSTTEVKIKGYINIVGYRIITDEKVDPGRYGFKIIHDSDRTHFFSSDEQLVIREWMKALMKATIDRDYTIPVQSTVNIPTIPLTVAQAMNPAPRPPSPTARAATQKAMRRENTNQLSTRDAQVLMMNLPGSESTTTSNTKEGERTRLDSFFTNDTVSSAEGTKGSVSSPKTPKAPVPARPSREMRRITSSQSEQTVLEPGLIEWANSHLPRNLQISDTTGSVCGGLALLRLAESIKGRPCSPPVPDSAFPSGPNDDKLDGLFRLFDFLLDNDVKMGSVSINDVRLGKRDKIVQLLKALKAWEDKRRAIAQSIGKGSMQAGPFIAPVSWNA